MERSVQPVRSNVVLCGHAAAGKTSLIDRLLAITGSVNHDPDIHRRTSVCDTEPEEHAHGHTIESAIVHCQHVDGHLNLLDTPGHGDFIGSTIAALGAAELAAVCVNAHSGIQMNTRRVFDEATRAARPMCIIVTKLEDPLADYASLVDRLRQAWGNGVLPITVPLGRGESLRGVASVIDLPIEARDAAINLAAAHESLVEKLIETDETLMEQYFAGISPDAATLKRLLGRAVAARQFIPVLAVSTAMNIGLIELLDAIVSFAPPASVDQAADQPLAALVFKTRIDPFVQKVSYLKIVRGTLSRDSLVRTDGCENELRIGQPMAVNGVNLEPLGEPVGPGQIIALGKLDDLHIGDIIRAAAAPTESLDDEPMANEPLPKLTFPGPMVAVAVSTERRGDETKLTMALQKLTEEDPTLKVSRDPQTGELVVAGLSELHLQVVRERMSRRDKIDIETHEPRIAYRETITSPSEGFYRHKKQSGGRGQFGEVHLRMMPLPRGTDIDAYLTKSRFPQMKSHHYHAAENFLCVDSVVGGAIPGNFMPGIEKGLLDLIHAGVLAGCPVQDLAIEIFDGKHHPVDSSEQAFRTAASMCFRELFRGARPALLEPIAKMQITVMDDHVGDIFSDISGRGGRLLGSESGGPGWQLIQCEVPSRAIGHYGRTLSSITAGTGSYTLQLSHYECVPAEIQKQLIDIARTHQVVG